MNAQQLKNAILQMAVSGKLVPQNPEDEPASVLLERIRKEKEELIKSGKIKREKNHSRIFRGPDNTFYEQIGNNAPVPITDELPFDIPDSWEWVRISSVLSINPRNNIDDELIVGFIPMTLIDDGFNNHHTFEKRKWKDIKKGFTHFRNGDLVVAKITPCFQNRKSAIITNLPNGYGSGTTELYVLRDESKMLFIPYILILCKTQHFINGGIVSFTGTAGQQRVGKEYILNYLIPLPPLSEQIRICKKTEVLRSLVDKYEIAEFELNLLSNSLHDQLKKSILQQTVQGKLVPQDPDDEPASVLLERIRKEKERLIAEGKIKRDKNESVIYKRNNSYYEKINGAERCIDDEIPFDIPDSWEWARWGSISESIQYGFNAPAKDSGRIKMVRISDIQEGKVNWKSVPYCEIKEEEIGTYLLKKNDILFARTGGTVGKSFLVQDVPVESIYAGYLIRTRYSVSLCPYYLKYFMESELYWNQLKEGTTSTAQPNCNGKTLSNMLIPIPPQIEQHRIVDKIEELMPMIKAL